MQRLVLLSLILLLLTLPALPLQPVQAQDGSETEVLEIDWTVKPRQYDEVTAALFVTDVRMLAALDEYVALINFETSKSVFQIQLDYEPEQVAASATSGYFATGDRKQVELRDLENGDLVREFTGIEKEVNDLAFSPDGTLLAAADREAQVIVWDVATGDIVTTFDDPNWDYNRFQALEFSADGRYLLASATNVGSVWVWELATETPTLHLEYETGDPVAVSMNPAGTLIAVAWIGNSFKWYVDVWDTLSGAQVHQFQFEESTRTLAFSPDGQHLVVGSDGVFIYTVTTGTLVASADDTSTVNSINFSPSGDSFTLATRRGIFTMYNDMSVFVTVDTVCEGTISTDVIGVFMYGIPNADTEPRLTIPGGAALTVEEQAGDWSQVTYDGTAGWIMNAGLIADCP